jgi:succinate dehydrogenase / fumarate reductase cytochrome b subunit
VTGAIVVTAVTGAIGAIVVTVTGDATEWWRPQRAIPADGGRAWLAAGVDLPIAATILRPAAIAPWLRSPKTIAEPAMAQADRPLSPHIQIYRWPLSMALSIAHRATGIGLALGLILVTWWLLALASGPDAFATVQAVMRSWLGVLVLFFWSLALFFHLGNGVRHLVWDAGYGYEIETARKSGIAVLIFAGAMTVLTWLVIALVG